MFMGNDDKMFWLIYSSSRMVPAYADILNFFLSSEMIPNTSNCYVAHLNLLILASKETGKMFYINFQTIIPKEHLKR